jgi:hypothetical protein
VQNCKNILSRKAKIYIFFDASEKINSDVLNIAYEQIFGSQNPLKKVIQIYFKSLIVFFFVLSLKVNYLLSLLH